MQIGVVIGGGNIFRGIAPAASGMDRATADYMGMLATVMNALALKDAMSKAGLVARAIGAGHAASGRALCARQGHAIPPEEGKNRDFGAGTGNPSSPPTPPQPLRGIEMGADVMPRPPRWMACTRRPQENPDAVRYQSLTFDEAIARNLKVMDATAFALCRDQQFDLKVFSILKQGAPSAWCLAKTRAPRTLLSLSPDGAHAVSLNRRGGACCPPAPCEPRQTGVDNHDPRREKKKKQAESKMQKPWTPSRPT